ncbi:MAG: efflux RND transporter permease subunit [Ignavibacteriae bacterium]|nr:efflux RND transporter permease subunit [Ignavibacteriota bacterium]
MKFFKLIVDNKVTIYILILIILIMGVVSYTSLPRESSPSIKIPYVFVSTIYPGVTPQDIENLVTQVIEKEVKGISGVKKITSVSRESFSSISVEFNTDVVIDDAIQKVRDKVSTAKTKMPQDIKEPVITEINFSELPMMYINISGNIGLDKLKKTGDRIRDKIEEFNGVLSADVVGGLDREVKIDVDANRLKYYNLSFNDIIGTVSAENLNIPGGAVDVGKSSFLIRVPGEYKDPEKMSDIIVTSKNNLPVYIKDVAQVTYGFKERQTYARESGKESVTIMVKKRSGANIIEIADKVKALLKDNKELIPEGVEYSITGDESNFIKNTVHELENGIVTGVILVCLVLFFFMGLKNSLLVATSIPLSFLISFIVLSMLGITLNMLVLFTLILVLGIIVDDAIVVVENIYRLQEKENYSPYDAAIEGPKEVVFPVTIATLTIIASFFPLLFFPGIIGDFMKYLPITLIICLLSSLFVAMVISPVQASIFIHFKRDKEKSQKKKFRPVGKFLEFFDHKFFGTSLAIYEKVVRKTLIYRKTSIGLTVFLLFFVTFIYGLFNNGVEFFPDTDPRQVNINVTTPVGTNIETTNKVTKTIEDKIPPIRDIQYIVTNVGSSNNPLDFSGEGIPNKSTVTINFYDKLEREQSSTISVDEIRKAIKDISGGEVEVQKEQNGPPTGPPVNIEISGDDFVKLGELSEQIKKLIKDIPGLADLIDNFDEARPEMKVTVDREKAALYELNTAMIGATIRTAINGTTASKIREGKDEYDVTVRLAKNQRNDIDMIDNMYITNKSGQTIPISSIGKVEFSGGIGAINRKDLKRVVTVSANAEGRLGNDVLKDVMTRLEGFKLPDGYNIKYTGEQEDQEESSSFLSKALVIALLLIFFLMVIEFNSIRVPLLIMFSVMLSLIGVFLGLLITGTPFGIIMTGIGIIALAGIVVRNAIVLLDFQKELVKRGLERDEALVQAGLIRMRPIFLTAAATILGIIPLASGVDFDWRTFSWIIGGENSAFWRPMGVAIIFGLAVSTFLTLVIIPTLYSASDDLFRKFGRKNNVQAPENPDFYKNDRNKD